MSNPNDELLNILKMSLCPSVVQLDGIEVHLDVPKIIESDFVGGYPVHDENDLECPF